MTKVFCILILIALSKISFLEGSDENLQSNIQFIIPKKENNPKFREISEKLEKSSESFYQLELGFRLVKDIYLTIGEKLDNFAISRNIEFYDDISYSPFVRISFRDILLSKKSSLYFRNSLEGNYLSFDKQRAFSSETGLFPYKDSFSVGTKVDSINLFWRSDILYKTSIFSGGVYFGGGMNILSGNAIFLRYSPSDINSSLSQNLGIFGDGYIIEKGEGLSVDLTTSLLLKYGFVINFQFTPFHLAFGVDYGVTSEINLYWIERNYFLELSYLF